MSDPSDSLFILLSIGYACLAIAAASRIYKIVEPCQGVDCCSCLRPYTSQKAVFFIIFISCIKAISAWSNEEGRWKSHFYTVYVLDSLASLLFFSLSCVLSLFWAEMYHISDDTPQTFKNLLVPFVILCNLSILVCIIIFWYTSDSTWSSGAYSDGSYPYIILSFYILGAGLLLLYSSKATHELGTAPIDIALRTERHASIKFLSSVIILTLIGRGVLLLIIVNSDISINSAVSWILAFAWFVCVDYTPLSLCLYHYWKISSNLSSSNRDYLKEAGNSVEKPEDSTSLLRGGSNGSEKQQQLPKRKSDDKMTKNGDGDGDNELTI